MADETALMGASASRDSGMNQQNDLPNLIGQLFNKVSPEYKSILLHENVKKTLMDILKQIIPMRKELAPEFARIFYAFEICPWDELSVVIIGQDPYPALGEAQGLAFSTFSSRKTPKSLHNIYNCLVEQKLFTKMPNHGNLESWASQGVLLLNTYLTTIVGKSEAHPFWSLYTAMIIDLLIERKPDLIFMLWGNKAIDNFSAKIKNKNSILSWGHPSPLSAYNKSNNPKNFKYCTNFNSANDLLKKLNLPIINWNSVNSADDTDYSSVTDDADSVAVSANICPDNPDYVVGTDGSARKNGKTNCVAASAYVIVEVAPENLDTIEDPIMAKIIINEKCELVADDVTKASNNRGELGGIKSALEYITVNDRFKEKNVVILSDSMYCINTLTKWYKK